MCLYAAPSIHAAFIVGVFCFCEHSSVRASVLSLLLPIMLFCNDLRLYCERNKPLCLAILLCFNYAVQV